MQESYEFNIIAISISLVLMIGYNIHVYAVSLRSIFVIDDQDPKFKMQLAKNWSASTVWMQKHAEKNDAPSVTLAVQTFRNSIIVSTFVGTLTFQAAISMINGYTNTNDIIEKIRILILSLLLFFSFLCWASVIRCAAHLGYKVGVLSKNNTAQANYMSYSDKVDIPNLGLSQHHDDHPHHYHHHRHDDNMEKGTFISVHEVNDENCINNNNDGDNVKLLSIIPNRPIIIQSSSSYASDRDNNNHTTNNHTTNNSTPGSNSYSFFKSNRSVSTASLTNSEYSRFELIAPETPGREEGSERGGEIGREIDRSVSMMNNEMNTLLSPPHHHHHHSHSPHHHHSHHYQVDYGSIQFIPIQSDHSNNTTTNNNNTTTTNSNIKYESGIFNTTSSHPIISSTAMHDTNNNNNNNDSNSNNKYGQMNSGQVGDGLDNFLAHECHMMMVMLLSFSLGFRFLFVSIPFFIFAAGPIALLLLTIIMLMFLYLWDHLFTFNDLIISESAPKRTKPFLLPTENTPGAVRNISGRSNTGWQLKPVSNSSSSKSSSNSSSNHDSNVYNINNNIGNSSSNSNNSSSSSSSVLLASQ